MAASSSPTTTTPSVQAVYHELAVRTTLEREIELRSAQACRPVCSVVSVRFRAPAVAVLSWRSRYCLYALGGRGVVFKFALQACHACVTLLAEFDMLQNLTCS